MLKWSTGVIVKQIWFQAPVGTIKSLSTGYEDFVNGSPSSHNDPQFLSLRIRE